MAGTSGSTGAELPSSKPETKQKALIDTVSKACAYGDLDRLKELLAGDKDSKDKAVGSVSSPSASNLEALSTPDAEGYYPLQWAALNNQTLCVTFLLEDPAARKHVDINARDVPTGQTALHWAAVRGCVSVLKILHEFGAKMNVKDNKGYTCAHVAAQYGQTEFLYTMKMRCKTDVVGCLDNDLRSSLHWACYQGHGDTARLLMYLGADIEHSDKEKCTPLHWASIKGNGHITHMLAQAASLCEGEPTAKGNPTYVDRREDYLLAKDGTGSNSIELARQKGHVFVATQMESQLKKAQAWTKTNKVMSFLVKLEFLPVLLFAIIGLLVAYTRTVVFLDENGENAPATASSVFWAFVVLIPSIVGLGVLYRCSTMDPGFLATGQAQRSKREELYLGKTTGSPGDSEDDRLLSAKDSAASNRFHHHNSGVMSMSDDDHTKGGGGEIISKVDLDMMYIHQELDSPALWAGNWTQICPTCKIVKPLRAKHDAFSNRCVENFDHHCPWVANAIGKQNRWHFFVFLVLQMWALVVSIAIACYKLSHLNKSASHATPYIVSFLVFDGSLGISVLTLLCAQGNSIARNITTNEMANSHRYSYLGIDSIGRIFNPFDKGYHQNCMEVIYPSKGITPVRLEEEMYQKIRDWITDKHIHEAPCKPCCSKPNQRCGAHARENIV